MKLIKRIVQVSVVLILVSSLIPASASLAAPGKGVTVRSVSLLDPNPTSAEVVRFLVNFSHPVIDVDLGDFGLTLTGEISGVQLVGISGTGKTRTVSVNTGLGNGTIRLDVIDNDTIESTGGVYFEHGFFGGQAYTIEKGPVVPVAALPDANPTSADSVDFVITFPGEVGSIGLSDFTPITTGTIRDVAVLDVQGSGDTYVISVSTGHGDGTISLAISENNKISDLNGNPFESAAFSADAYSVERPFPIVLDVLCLSTGITSAASVDFSVIFSRPVIDLDKDDFALAATGDLAGAAVTSLSGTGAEYTVGVHTGTGSGTIRLDVIDNDTIEDLNGNYFEEPFSGGEPCTIQRETIETIFHPGEYQDDPGSYVFEVVFSSPVDGFDGSDLLISGISDTAIVNVTGSGAVYQVEITGLSGDEQITIDLVPNTVQNEEGNVAQASSRTERIADLVAKSVLTPEESPANNGVSAIWILLIAVLVIIAVVMILTRRKK
ncbi:MAG: hypothetical protein DRJ13_07315 [Bacteroidetes bacterium]|nr:MAG: hypothetical protein DRJ13_07315 [Bacteroidota bacterium]